MYTRVELAGDYVGMITRSYQEDAGSVHVEGLTRVSFDLPRSHEDAVEGPKVQLDWANSAGISLDEENDRITLWVSTGDPRGAFVIEFWRHPDGRVMLSTPTPDDPLPHEPLTRLREGHYVVGEVLTEDG